MTRGEKGRAAEKMDRSAAMDLVLAEMAGMDNISISMFQNGNWFKVPTR